MLALKFLMMRQYYIANIAQKPYLPCFAIEPFQIKTKIDSTQVPCAVPLHVTLSGPSGPAECQDGGSGATFGALYSTRAAVRKDEIWTARPSALIIPSGNLQRFNAAQIRLLLVARGVSCQS